MTDEQFAAFFVVWKTAMHDMVQAARHGDRVRRNRFEAVLSALIDAYPSYAQRAMDPKAKS